MSFRCLPALLASVLTGLAACPLAAQPTPFLNATLVPGQSGTHNGAVFLRGTSAKIYSEISKCLEQVPNCPNSFSRSSLYYRLPPGLSYVSHWASAPVAPATCTVTPLPGGGEDVACTGGGLVGWSWATYSRAQVRLDVAVAPTAPLGAMRVLMAVDDQLPAQSDTLAECVDDPVPNYCTQFNGSIGVAPAAQLVIGSLTHTPGVFEVDNMSAQIEVFARNNGNAASNSTHILVSLPPGFQWLPASTTVIGPALSCSAAGHFNDGQTITCSGALPAPGPGPATVSLRLGIRPRNTMEVPGPLPVVAAVHEGPAPDNAVLLACASDPSPAHCAWHGVPTWIPCANRYADGIFCDGFQPPEAVLMHPARMRFEED